MIIASIKDYQTANARDKKKFFNRVLKKAVLKKQKVYDAYEKGVREGRFERVETDL